MENVAIGLAYRPEAILAVIAAGIFPDQNRPRENSSAIVETDTAFAQRHAQYNVGIMAQWTDGASGDPHIDWARGLWDAMRPHSSGHYLLNFISEEPADMIRAAFGANHARLVELKKKYDPTNFFSLNQNVRPTSRPIASR